MPLPSLSKLPENYIIQVKQLGLIRVTGEETSKYLQGQLTCDVLELAEKSVMRAGHCDHKGKMHAVFELYKTELGINLITSQDSLKAALEALKKFGVFAKVDISDESENLLIFQINGNQALTLVAQQFDFDKHGPRLQNHDQASLILNNDQSATLILAAELKSQLDDLQIESLDDSVWLGLQSQAGLAQLYGDNISQYVPQMLNLQALDAISFTKGCYTGQETVARMKYLGKLKRKTFIISGSVSSTPNTQDDIEMELSEDKWRRAGTLLQCYVDDQQHLIGLAVLPGDIAMDTRLRIKNQPDTRLVLEQLPYAIPTE